eukprot:SAG11_NODE_808_length_7088_cov_5.136357_3_plen_253_part_00
MSFDTDLSLLQTEEQQVRIRCIDRHLPFLYLMQWLPLPQTAYIEALANQLGVRPDQLKINLPRPVDGDGRRRAQTGGMEVVIEGDAPADGEERGAALDASAMSASIGQMDGVEGVEAEVIEPDCRGVPGGDAVVDVCGLCGGDGTSCLDCLGAPNGLATVDRCGTCDDDSSNDCVQDCAGNWGGVLSIDVCGVCGGDGSTCLDCQGGPAEGHIDFVSVLCFLRTLTVRSHLSTSYMKPGQGLSGSICVRVEC